VREVFINLAHHTAVLKLLQAVAHLTTSVVRKIHHPSSDDLVSLYHRYIATVFSNNEMSSYNVSFVPI